MHAAPTFMTTGRQNHAPDATDFAREQTEPAPQLSPWRAVRFGLWLVLALAAWPGRGAEAELKVGEVFPALDGFGLEGQLPASWKGRIAVVDFWASWCEPCQHTFPILEELHHRFGKQGLVILAINEDRSKAAMVEFLKEYPVTFTVLRDAKKKLAATVNVPSLPCSYVLDREGKVHLIVSGEKIARSRKEFVRQVEELLALPSPPKTP
jgi:thiol-disulfide isomerase/thioredoxin